MHAGGQSPEWGAFSERGPWRIADDVELTWAADLEKQRSAAIEALRARLQPPAMPPLGRFSLGALLIGSAVAGWWLRERRSRGSASAAGLARRFRRAFAALGPSYIKLGQIVSSGRGLFPDEVVDEFSELRDRVAPVRFARIRRLVERELGAPLEKVFRSFERRCIASASIAQVHAAVLSTGEPVVVKVQRPGVDGRLARDVSALAWLAPRLVGRLPLAALANPPALLELFAETLSEELDFRLEAQNMLDIARVLNEAGQRAVVVPRPHPRLVTRRVLVMERLDGFGYEDIRGMTGAGIDTTAVARDLLIAFLEGAMIYGVFHGDLHGGNLAVMPDGRVALYDYGITGRMDSKQRLAFLRMALTAAVNDMSGHLEALRDLGALAADADIAELARVLHFDSHSPDPLQLSSADLVRELQGVLKALLAHGARLPKHVVLYVKGMLFFDGAVAALAPQLNVFNEIAEIYAYFVRVHGERIAQEIGLDPRALGLDLSRVRETLGLPEDAESLTYRELQRRREEIRDHVDASRDEILAGLDEA